MVAGALVSWGDDGGCMNRRVKSVEEGNLEYGWSFCEGQADAHVGLVVAYYCLTGPATGTEQTGEGV